ncbi:MAG: acyl-CoA thioesterase [Cyclobacteriaceae bacterium]|jgi:acyl-CoA thioester hydrolase|nr:acyl-CoA thioesterase [Cyclobacteriaceae bacterium]
MAAPFTHRLRVHPADIDDLGHVNNVVYVRWVQEVATAHWLANSTPALRSQFAWVVLRHEIDYRAPVYLGDALHGQTWVGKAEGARFERFVHLFKKEVLVAEAKTWWCLLDANSGKPKRITPDMEQRLALGA